MTPKIATRRTQANKKVNEDKKPKDGVVCEDCGNRLMEYSTPNGKSYTIDELVKGSQKVYGKTLCYSCLKGKKK